MEDYQRDFFDLAISSGALRFGEFTLKSGRVSPYFFNVGEISSGERLSQLGDAYAAAIGRSGLQPDVLFGPAYKGIPIATATGIAMHRAGQGNPGVAFDRKEVKDHGEGGWLVGASLEGRVLVLDDVVTDGAAKRGAAEQIRSTAGTLIGVVVALDRQERGATQRSAVTELAEDLQVPVVAVVTLADLLVFLEERGRGQEQASVRQYQDQYGA